MADSSDKAKWDALYASGGGEMFDHNIIGTVVQPSVLDKATNGKPKAHFFLPLCGKSPEMAWLLAQGYAVTGVEWSEQAVTQFFAENKLEHTIEADVSVGGGTAVVYKATEAVITIYCCDFLTVRGDAIGTFDCIWDSGSICSFRESQRPAYAATIRSLLKPDGHYLLSVFSYEESPDASDGHDHHAIMPHVVKALFGEWFDIELAQNGDRDLMIKMFSYEEDGHHGDHSHGDHPHGDQDHADDSHDHGPPVSEWEWDIHLLTPKN